MDREARIRELEERRRGMLHGVHLKMVEEEKKRKEKVFEDMVQRYLALRQSTKLPDEMVTKIFSGDVGNETARLVAEHLKVLGHELTEKEKEERYHERAGSPPRKKGREGFLK